MSELDFCTVIIAHPSASPTLGDINRTMMKMWMTLKNVFDVAKNYKGEYKTPPPEPRNYIIAEK